ncbi:MAG: hypothetical protein U5K54_13605 [Cytophagales bacterium]|nr:hypothetical protein [Cytophagales bacterium]
MNFKSLLISITLLIGLFSCQQNKTQQKVESTNSSNEMPNGMIWIAGGEFMMGCTGEIVRK